MNLVYNKIVSYYKNKAAGVTKERYYEICEAIGSSPLEEEIPVELADFPDLVQLAFRVYDFLQDNWDTVGGSYMGKNMVGLLEIFEILDIDDREERKLILELVVLIDSARSKQISSSKPKNKTPTT